MAEFHKDYVWRKDDEDHLILNTENEQEVDDEEYDYRPSQSHNVVIFIDMNDEENVLTDAESPTYINHRNGSIKSVNATGTIINATVASTTISATSDVINATGINIGTPDNINVNDNIDVTSDNKNVKIINVNTATKATSTDTPQMETKQPLVYNQVLVNKTSFDQAVAEFSKNMVNKNGNTASTSINVTANATIATSANINVTTSLSAASEIINAAINNLKETISDTNTTDAEGTEDAEKHSIAIVLNHGEDDAFRIDEGHATEETEITLFEGTFISDKTVVSEETAITEAPVEETDTYDKNDSGGFLYSNGLNTDDSIDYGYPAVVTVRTSLSGKILTWLTMTLTTTMTHHDTYHDT